VYAVETRQSVMNDTTAIARSAAAEAAAAILIDVRKIKWKYVYIWLPDVHETGDAEFR